MQTMGAQEDCLCNKLPSLNDILKFQHASDIQKVEKEINETVYESTVPYKEGSQPSEPLKTSLKLCHTVSYPLYSAILSHPSRPTGSSH